ncbi:MAG: hypothetical protein RLZZ241_1968 [Bacteroidota bacterium]
MQKSIPLENQEIFFERLRAELQRSSLWPSLYLYKFIVPSEPEKVQSIHSIFEDAGAVIQSRQSRNGKYTSLSIKVKMNSPEAVIEKYLEVGKVEGVISL